MYPERRLELVHFQISKKCNLHCWFCGQWGEKGSFASQNDSEMRLQDWQQVIHSLVRYSESTGTKPSIILWGGEPLMSSFFLDITEYLFELGFPLGLITNGTLIDRYDTLCKKAFDRIYISLDGPQQIHDAIRGPGVYEKVAENLRLLHGGRAKLTIMTVLTPSVTMDLEAALLDFEKLQPDEVLLQEMIAFTPPEVIQYQVWLKREFGINAVEIMAWQMQDQLIPRDHQWYVEWIRRHSFSFPVVHLPHGAQTGTAYCLSPFRHVHIAWNGSVGFCTDFGDFSVGNVRVDDLLKLFYCETADSFRHEVQCGNCVTCEHCSWRNSIAFDL